MAQYTDPQAHFPIEWRESGDADLVWTREEEYGPGVMKPLDFDLFCEPFTRGLFPSIKLRLFNYYLYITVSRGPGGRPTDKSTPDPAPDEIIRELVLGRNHWLDDILPEVKKQLAYYKETNFDEMTRENLANEIENLAETRVHQGQLHTEAMAPWRKAMSVLIETHKRLAGQDDLDALRLVQGYPNKNLESTVALWRLSRLVRTAPPLWDLVEEHKAVPGNEFLDMLKSTEDAQSFLGSFSAFLEEYGWRSDRVNTLSIPTWAEDPTSPLSQLRSYINMKNYDPEEQQRQLIADRDKAEKETLKGLSASDRDHFVNVLSIVRELAPIKEDHAFYIDQRLTCLSRRLILAAGRRLAADEQLVLAEEVFYLGCSELKSALRDPLERVESLARERKQAMDHWNSIQPPSKVGKVMRSETDMNAPPVSSRMSHDYRTSELKGEAGSAGYARGPARVLRDVNEIDRLGPQDILVAFSITPPWSPLLAIPVGLVTETGGVLSHAAVTAREYGVPAVVGVDGATRMIREGDTLEIDGSRGSVRIIECE